MNDSGYPSPLAALFMPKGWARGANPSFRQGSGLFHHSRGYDLFIVNRGVCFRIPAVGGQAKVQTGVDKIDDLICIEHPPGVVDQVLIGIEGFGGEFCLTVLSDKVEDLGTDVFGGCHKGLHGALVEP